MYPWSFSRLALKAPERLPNPNLIPSVTPSPSPFPRYGHTLTPTPTSTGELVLFGGLVDNQPRNDVYLFSTEDRFPVRLLETFGDIPSPRFGHACAVVGNAVMIWGGDTRTDQREKPGEGLDSSLYVLNVGLLSFFFLFLWYHLIMLTLGWLTSETRKWTKIVVLGPSPEGRYGHTMTVIGTKLYIFGGQTDAQFSNDVIVFDIPSSTSSTLFYLFVCIAIGTDRDCFSLYSVRSGPQWELAKVEEDSPRPAKRTNHVCVPYKDRLIMCVVPSLFLLLFSCFIIIEY